VRIVVGISEMQVSANSADVLVTCSLGSCIGLSLYDPVMRIGGLIHCMLPLSKIDLAKAQTNPQTFTDTGVPALLHAMLDVGAKKRDLTAKVAGASRLLERRDAFNIGERNYIVLRKVLWKNSILIAAEDTGGTAGRTMSLHMDTGKTTVKTGDVETELV